MPIRSNKFLYVPPMFLKNTSGLSNPHTFRPDFWKPQFPQNRDSELSRTEPCPGWVPMLLAAFPLSSYTFCIRSYTFREASNGWACYTHSNGWAQHRTLNAEILQVPIRSARHSGDICFFSFACHQIPIRSALLSDTFSAFGIARTTFFKFLYVPP